MKGNFHVRFLGGLGLVTAPGYPTIAQKANHILTPDMIDGNIILSAHIIYDENMDGYVATRNTYKFRGDLAKAGFTWVQTKKVWFKPITIN